MAARKTTKQKDPLTKMQKYANKTKALQQKQKQRHRSYTKHVKPYLKEIRDLVLRGYTNKEIQEMLEVSVSSFYVWRKKFPEFDDIFTDDIIKNKLRDELMDSLYQRAKGMYVTEESTSTDGDGNIIVTNSNKRYIYSDKAVDHYIRNVLGDSMTPSEITISVKNGDETVNINFGSVDDEGDFEESR